MHPWEVTQIGAPHFFLLYTSPIGEHAFLISGFGTSVFHIVYTLYTDVLVLNLVAGYCNNKESQIIAMVRPKMWT